jgi:hypothetical protein
MSSSISVGRAKRAPKRAATLTWQVAQAAAPPH